MEDLFHRMSTHMLPVGAGGGAVLLTSFRLSLPSWWTSEDMAEVDNIVRRAVVQSLPELINSTKTDTVRFLARISHRCIALKCLYPPHTYSSSHTHTFHFHRRSLARPLLTGGWFHHRAGNRQRGPLSIRPRYSATDLVRLRTGPPSGLQHPARLTRRRPHLSFHFPL